MSFWMCKDCGKMIDNPRTICQCGCSECSPDLIHMDHYEALYIRERQKRKFFEDVCDDLWSQLQELRK